ncbi:NAD-dependent epimerase/dehydratase family protein [Paracoccus spongiarum]|uniref:NAD(P)-dependent oxidoreductase n=1 Tax=Paracoccus spongiarum TaxID=3064387 RepID=A0ABT9JCY6_9RHOB|nr:NAD(P)-dependent oxidoreductase [Paracoccus sp. 2205BS29-5]MDP5307693.1 NAD(P)-dependent oxidoreductase [Paracoccus sp. 2205BS29-5]
MRIAMTGAGGLVGSLILPVLRAAGHSVTAISRDSGFRLGDAPDLGGHEALIHCAFAHRPGRYRGGEGDDPAGFRAANLDGSITLFEAAAAQEVTRILFLSSRAVQDGQPPGMLLTDDLPACPADLYGEVKAGAEAHLAALAGRGIATTAIRATGIYGPGPAQKWRTLFAEHLAGRPAGPRVSTELHGVDLADAMLRLLAHPAPPRLVNASDLILDRHDLLAALNASTGCMTPPPDRACGAALRLPSCAALARMGWRPGGRARLAATLPLLLDPAAHL